MRLFMRFSVKGIVLSALGYIFIGLGAVGLVLPLLPTTPFVVLAVACFAAGTNNKISRWLKQNRYFGPYIENYRTGRGVEKALKIKSVIYVWSGLVISMVIIRTVWAYILLAVIGTCVTVHLLMIKTACGKRENYTNTNGGV